MRPTWWGCIGAVALLMCWGVYQYVSQPSSPAPQEVAAQPDQRPVDQRVEQPIADKHEHRLQQADAPPPAVKPDPLPSAPKEARVEDAAPATVVAKLDESRLPQADPAPPALKPDPLPAPKEARREGPSVANVVAKLHESRLPQTETAPPAVQPASLPNVQKEARLADPASAAPTEPSAPSDAKPDLSYLHYYAYSELPPDPRPADIVLKVLKDVPHGTPIEEIKRVADLLGMDFTFLKAIAKIESGFDPKQRTGSYIGLFQLSKHEFRKHGSGDILVARDNAVAAALKMMNEAVLFQMFTRRKTTLFDLYLIHQQGIEGAAEHLSQPDRLAWRSMCKTGEGKEKGERWCKLAIWGNTLPALKRTWKSVNKVTSRDFVAMWQERVSHFYSRYSQAAVAD